MDDHEEGESQRYRDAERDRIRYENIAYILNRHPIDGKHEEYLQAAGKGKRSSRMQSHDGAEKQNPAGHQEQTGTSPSPTPRAASQEKITLNNEPLEENEWPVFLQFKNSMRYKGKVLIDTGCRDNWISKHVIQKHHLPWHEDPNEELLRDFNNSETRSVGLTQSDWVWKNRIIPVEFKIASSAPFDVLFGYKFLLKWELVRLVPESPLAVLVTDKKRPDADGELAINRAKDRADRDADQTQQYLDWKARMRAEGWQWDKTKNNFYKIDSQGKQVWNKGGFRLESRAAVVAQRNV